MKRAGLAWPLSQYVVAPSRLKLVD